MTVITEDLDLPGAAGAPCQVEVTLVGAGGAPVTGYTLDGRTIVDRNVVVPDATGLWQLDLVPGSAIVPVGTVYRRVVHTPKGVVGDATFDVPATGGPYRLKDRLVDPPDALAPAALQVAIAASEAKRPHLLNWYAASDWNQFSMVPVTNIDNTVTLTADGGRGVATGSGPGASGNDRRLYLLATEAADVELRCDWELVAGTPQLGLAFRADASEAVIVWNNIFFGATTNILQGVWEYSGTFATNQAASFSALRGELLSASANGSTATFRTRLPHQLPAGGTFLTIEGVGSFGLEVVTSVPDATTFAFASTATGSWTGGNFVWTFVAQRRKVAARLVGNRVTWKQWLPGDPEPSWTDPLRAATATLPATLTGSAGPPPTWGRVGILIAHLGNGGQVRVSDLVVTVLD